MISQEGTVSRETQDAAARLLLYRALRRDLLATINDMQFFRGRDRVPSSAALMVRDRVRMYCKSYQRVARRIRHARGLLS